MSVVRVRTKETLEKPSVSELILRSVESTRYPGTAPGLVYLELLARIQEEGMGVFIGMEERCPRGIVVVVQPTSALMMAPQVAIAYNEGTFALKREVSSTVRRWLVECGHKTALGVNLHRDDRVFMRGLRHFGKPSRKGSLIEFDLT